MNLEQALAFSSEKQADGYTSDGCTFAPDLGIRRFCIMHDMLRRFKPVSKYEADVLFFKGIMSKGLRYLPVAVIYFLAVRIASVWYK